MSVLTADEVVVAYPGNRALDGVTLRMETGTIHVLAGQNGAGKSTLIKVLGGSLTPQGGRVVLDGEVLHLRHPADAAQAGIRVVPQELQLFGHLSVWENVMAGVIVTGGRRARRRLLRQRARDALRRLGEEMDENTIVGDLSPAQQQRVTVARAIVQDTRFLIFDEPTAALSREERTTLLDVIRRVAGGGVAVLFVSHHLEESLAIGKEVSVLRDGRLVWTRPRSEVDEATLTAAMFGSAEGDAIRTPSAGQISSVPGEPLLSARQLRWVGGRHALDLDVRGSEIVGIAGLPGSGADTLNGALLGRAERRGWVQMRGRPVADRTTSALAVGLGLIPGDRKASGIFAQMTLTDNLCAPRLNNYASNGILNGRRMRGAAQRTISDLAIAGASPDVPISNLSGGNQQKVLVGRWLGAGVSVLLADEPTRGVDVGTRRQIHTLLREFAAEGGACVIYSSDLSEIVEISTRLVVLHREGPPQTVPASLSADELYEVMSSARKESTVS